MFDRECDCDVPVEALDLALRESLPRLHPALRIVMLTDYRVHSLEPHRGAAARVAASIEWSGPSGTWTTIGVSVNIVETSQIALSGAVRLEAMRAGESDEGIYQFEDDSWAI